jgi:hypothetical protein
VGVADSLSLQRDRVSLDQVKDLDFFASPTPPHPPLLADVIRARDTAFTSFTRFLPMQRRTCRLGPRNSPVRTATSGDGYDGQFKLIALFSPRQFAAEFERLPNNR